MKRYIIFSVLLISWTWINAQIPLKHIVNHTHGTPQPIHLAQGLPSIQSMARKAGGFNQHPLCSILTTHEAIESQWVTSSGSLWINLRENHLWSSRSSVKDLMAELLPNSVFEKNWAMEWAEVSEETDPGNISHIRIQQTLAGHPIHGQDMILHIQNSQLRDMNGFAWTGKTPVELPAPVPENEAMHAAKKYLQDKGIQFQAVPQLAGLHHPEDNAQLSWFPDQGKLTLVYEINIHPNMLDHWTLFVDATGLEVVKAYSQLCSIFPKQLYNFSNKINSHSSHSSHALTPLTLLGDGPTTVADQDLLGQNRTVNAYLVGTNFFMIDASRTGMYDATQSVMPNEPSGVIWTVDGQNGSPQKENFEVIHVTNTNNNWENLEVSAHYNAGESFEYFRQRFNRNSLNGNGGNIISIINITDENGNGLDNAFWSGAAMFYGNGDVAFSPLAKALDVAGHEMSHGVIQNTANLEYVGQSGALNESYADVFGVMIDRDDWQLAEDVANPAFFPTGAMRDLSNPNNGGNGPNDPGWQPKHMNEYQNLPNTPEGDNGGVHVNSGIPNKAFFLLATSIGKDKAEQIYYKALRDYLVKSSQFIDMRNAVEKAAGDLHGAGSPEVLAVRAAFDGVGIGSGQGGDHQDDIEVNTGDDFIIATDENESFLYWVPPDDPNQFVQLDVPAPLSRPSFTDDGSACVYVDRDNNMVLITFNWVAGLNYSAFYIDQQGLWRNIAVSKDGSKIAFTTSNLTNEIWVYDYISEIDHQFFLFNPTSAQGVSTGDVLYPDVMEWDYSGEFIMYDALNRIESSFGDGIEYWDISFLEAWNNDANDFGLGQIGKLFSTLPENVSIGNPTFAKNSPYIITFDFLETTRDISGQEQTDYRIIAANIEAGIANDIFQNTTVGYPSYSRLDDQILFTYDDVGTLKLATIDLQDSDKTLPVPGSAVFLLSGAQKGVWFQTGDRIFTATTDIDNIPLISLWPQPAGDIIHMTWGNLSEKADYKICDLSGRIVKYGVIDAGQPLQISTILPGTYFISLRLQDSQYYRSRFVKQ